MSVRQLFSWNYILSNRGPRLVFGMFIMGMVFWMASLFRDQERIGKAKARAAAVASLEKAASEFPWTSDNGTSVSTQVKDMGGSSKLLVGLIKFSAPAIHDPGNYEYVFKWQDDRWTLSGMLNRDTGMDCSSSRAGQRIMNDPGMKEFLDRFR